MGPSLNLNLVVQLLSHARLCDTMDCSPPVSSVQGDSPGQNTGVGSLPFSRGSSRPRDRTQSPQLQADALPSEPPRKPLIGMTLG